MCFCFPQLSQSIEKKDKEIEALRKMTVVYDNTPNFGKATDTKDVRGGPDPLALRWNVALTHMHFGPVLGTWQEENTLTHARDIMSLEKVKLEAQITLLTKAGGTHPAVSLSARTRACVHTTLSSRVRPHHPHPPTTHPNALVSNRSRGPEPDADEKGKEGRQQAGQADLRRVVRLHRQRPGRALV